MILSLLLIACSDQGFQVITRQGLGGAPAIEVEPTALDFWSVAAGDTEALTFDVRNVGDALLAVETLELIAPADFTLLDDPGGFSLEYGEERTFTVAFSPTEFGERSGRVLVRSTDSENPEVPVSLTGAGLVPWLEITPDPYDFGEIAVPCPAAASLVLQNVGLDDLTISGLEYESGGPLTLREPSTLPLTLPPGGLTTVWVDLAPAAAGSAAGTLTVISNDPRGDLTAEQSATLVAGALAEEAFMAPADPPVDILFAIDQSCSMDDDAISLGENFTAFIEEIQQSTADWHVGVATYDHGCLNGGTLSAGTPDVEAIFSAAVIAGEDGEIEDDEALFQIIDRALQQDGAGGCNEGFQRADAPLHVIVVSDEPERSPEEASAWGWDYWLERYWGYAPLLTLSGVVDSEGCNEGDDGYREAIAATGGERLSICGGDWAADAQALAAASTAFLFTFPLAQQPVPGSIVALVEGEEVSAGWSYDEASNAVIFEALEPGQAVTLRYTVAAACE